MEDPATGAAAAAFGGYLRELGKIGHTAPFTIRQGAEMGRPSLIEVSVMEGEPGVRVRGFASGIDLTPRPREVADRLHTCDLCQRRERSCA